MKAYSFIVTVLTVAASAFATPVPLTYISPDHELKGIIVPVGRDAGAKEMNNRSDQGYLLEYECRVEIYTTKGEKIWSEDFSSPDQDHGRGVVFALWSPDSNYFVFSTTSSGGHHPWQFFTYAYSRRQNKLFILDSLLGEVIKQKFRIKRPDIISLTIFDRSIKDTKDDWPSKTVKISLSKLLDYQKPQPEDLLKSPPIYSPYQ
jgi:hypothetical protein